MDGWKDQPQAGYSSMGLTSLLLAHPPPDSCLPPRDTPAGVWELPDTRRGCGHVGWRVTEGGDPGERPAAGPGDWAKGTWIPRAPHVSLAHLGLPCGTANAPLVLSGP